MMNFNELLERINESGWTMVENNKVDDGNSITISNKIDLSVVSIGIKINNSDDIELFEITEQILDEHENYKGKDSERKSIWDLFVDLSMLNDENFLTCNTCGYKQRGEETISSMMKRNEGLESGDIYYICGACMDNNI